jgi:tetratricopeptide (TPR) repeat protein
VVATACAIVLAGLAPALIMGCASTRPRAIAQEWFDLGNAWLEKGDWKQAGRAYSRALALDPSFAGASYNLARALTEAGDYDKALQALDALAKRDPKNIKILSSRAYALYKKGDAKAALAAYRKVLALDDSSPDAVYNTALLELAAGEASVAIADLRRLTDAKPDDGQAFLLLGRAIDQSSAGKASEDSDAAALAAYEKAKTLGKTDADALVRMAALYEKGKRYPEAMDALEAALKLDPKRAAAAFALARLRLVIADDADKGLEALKNALDAGFSDKDAAAALLAEPDLPERQKVFDLLKSKGLAE